MYHCDFFKDYKKIGIALFSFGKMKTNLQNAITCKSQIYNMVKFYKHIVKMLNMNKEEKKAF